MNLATIRLNEGGVLMKLLPYPQMPHFICYHNKAFPSGIIQANSPEDITKWLCTKCINVVYNPNSPQNKFDLSVWDIWGNSEGLTTQQVFAIKKDLIPLININMLSMFRTFIDHGCYILGTYNEKYIPLKWAYDKENYNHDFLIIGYDDDSFYSAGFVADSRFKHFKIPNKKLIDAVNDTGSSKVCINFFSYNEGAIPRPNTERMLSELNRYVSATNYLDASSLNTTTYGISALERLKNFFVDGVVNNGNSYVDKRYSRVLYEHEWILTQVIELFLDRKERIDYIKCACDNFNRAKLVHRLGLKMERIGESILIQRIARYMDEIIESEKMYLPKLIKVLEIKHKNGII